MSSYKPKQSKGATCAPRDVAHLELAADALGKTLVMGSELSFELQALAQNPTHPFHADGEAWVRQAFLLLQGMLIGERWLIEFLLGPTTKKDDICVDCFKPGWRFPEGPIADELKARLTPINKLVLHPTWNLLTANPRKWTLNRIASCVKGLDFFADELQNTLPGVAKILKSHVHTARSVLSVGRSDGFRWFDHSSLAVCPPTGDALRYEGGT